MGGAESQTRKAKHAELSPLKGQRAKEPVQRLRMSQECPICHLVVTENPRYRNYLCRTCAKKVCDIEARPLRLFQTGPEGRYAASYADTGAPYDSHEVYVDGIACWAEEARFGGIVVQAR